MSTTHVDSGVTAAAAPSLSLLDRAVAVFVRPAQAWSGLPERVQWWFPVLVMVMVGACSTALLYKRAIVPTQLDTYERQVASGQLTPEQMNQARQFFDSPAGLVFILGTQVVLQPVLLFTIGLLIWFGVGFVLGSGMRYRLGLEVACWSFLVRLPELILTTLLYWFRGSMEGVHVGFAILLPEVYPPSKMYSALAVLLDAIGPFALWYLAVMILGAAALSGAPRRSVAMTLSTLYLVIMMFVAGMTALFTPQA